MSWSAPEYSRTVALPKALAASAIRSRRPTPRRHRGQRRHQHDRHLDGRSRTAVAASPTCPLRSACGGRSTAGAATVPSGCDRDVGHRRVDRGRAPIGMRSGEVFADVIGAECRRWMGAAPPSAQADRSGNSVDGLNQPPSTRARAATDVRVAGSELDHDIAAPGLTGDDRVGHPELARRSWQHRRRRSWCHSRSAARRWCRASAGRSRAPGGRRRRDRRPPRPTAARSTTGRAPGRTAACSRAASCGHVTGRRRRPRQVGRWDGRRRS